jgi:CRISPR-associated protein Cas1
MKGSKVITLALNESGSHLGMEKGCFVIRDREGKEDRYPLFEKEIGEVILKSGNSVSTGALASLGFWDIDVMITTNKGRPVAILKGLDDDSHVETRLAQYEAVKSVKGVEIAKQIVRSKIEGRNLLLKKYALTPHDMQIERLSFESLEQARRKLTTIEGHHDEHYYFPQIFHLLPESIRPSNRRTFKAYDGINNLFNLGYEVLSWKVHRALIRAKLEPYLGFVHSMEFGKPSLVCDFIELYRYLIDDFVIRYCQKVAKKDFITKDETQSRNKRGKREYLNDLKTRDFLDQLNAFFESYVEIPRIKHGERQTIETLINEEALLFAKYLREEVPAWSPRIASLFGLNTTYENVEAVKIEGNSP